jgi:hypothetical protein
MENKGLPFLYNPPRYTGFDTQMKQNFSFLTLGWQSGLTCAAYPENR